mgnify:FL=1
MLSSYSCGMIELFANYRINNPRSSGDVSNGNEGKLKCMVNKHFPVFFQARILPGNWELPALMDTLAGAGWRLLKENLRCAAERFFTHERREPSVPRRGRRKSTVNKHFHRFFCRLPFAWKGREPAPHLMAVSFHRRVFPGSSGFPASLRNEEKIYCIRNRS